MLAALEQDLWWLALLILLSSFIAVIYVWKLIEVGIFAKAPDGAPRGEVPPSMLAPTWILIGLCVVFGLMTDLTAGVAETAAAQLMSVLP